MTHQHLIERLEKAEGADWTLYLEVRVALGLPLGRRSEESNVNAMESIDAALALVERVLPGWGMASATRNYTAGKPYWWIELTPNDGTAGYSDAEAPALTSAILIALLKAVEGGDG